MQPHKSEHKKGQQMDSFKQHNPNAHSTKQQNPNPQPHTSKRTTGHMECDQQESGAEALHISKCQLQPLRQQTTPSSRHAPQTSHSSHSNLNLADAMARAKVLDIDL
ncbi:uncharacterized protein LOC131040330 isoform X3 [Cryptomeria japonica]|uniref:uncharacterized protein LOC131040330 isoform X3 n=1 Tax=Cryptomeria japonica TaxID=3369 RepID=UPI0027DA8C9C|nr:uncharacterized protein LOC131040330 isoform X3 [Cryptomeria japonica]